MLAQWFYRLMLVIGLGLMQVVAGSASDLRTEKVEFAAGANQATVKGSIKGYEYVDYLLGADAGQTMVVSMSTNNASSYFNILEPGETDVAFFVGSTSGNNYTGALSKSGEYRVRVYMMRNAARRDEIAEFSLDIQITSADYADGLQGGPDYWQVTGVASDDQLNIRSEPSTKGQIVARVSDGAALRNMGCKMEGGQRWCRVETVGDVTAAGWAAGSYLMEGSYVPDQTSSSEPETRTENVKFTAGTNGALLADTLGGGDAINYVLGARNGQFLSVALLDADPATHFNIFMPNGELLYDSTKGGANGNQYRGQLYLDGDNTITVYSLATSGAASRFELDIRID